MGKGVRYVPDTFSRHLFTTSRHLFTTPFHDAGLAVEAGLPFFGGGGVSCKYEIRQFFRPLGVAHLTHGLRCSCSRFQPRLAASWESLCKLPKFLNRLFSLASQRLK